MIGAPNLTNSSLTSMGTILSAEIKPPSRANPQQINPPQGIPLPLNSLNIGFPPNASMQQSQQHKINNKNSDEESDDDEEVSFTASKEEIQTRDDIPIKKHNLTEIKQNAKSFLRNLKIKLQSDIDEIKVIKL